MSAPQTGRWSTRDWSGRTREVENPSGMELLVNGPQVFSPVDEMAHAWAAAHDWKDGTR